MPKGAKSNTKKAAERKPSKKSVSSASGGLKRGNMDYYLFAVVVVLLAFGLIMVFSASAANAYYEYGNSYHYVISQLRWAVLGMVVMFFMAGFDYHKLGKLSFPIVVVTLLLLVAVLAVGTEIKGAKRWLGVGGMTMQPSEMAKFAIIVFLSYKLSRDGGKIKEFFTGLVPYLGIIGLFCALVLLEKHLSGTVVVALISFLLLLVGGAKISHFVALGMCGVAGGVVAIIMEPYRMERITAFLDPFAHKMDEGWQIVQSLYAIGSGGLFGVGLGRSRQKHLYIPEPQNDFIFSIICEELGLLGAALVLILFAILIWRGVKIALSAPDKFGSLMAFGFTSLIAIQVIINVAVVTASMPVTGMQLPFFSAGGSSLVFILAGMGVLLNISRYSTKNGS